MLKCNADGNNLLHFCAMYSTAGGSRKLNGMDMTEGEEGAAWEEFEQEENEGEAGINDSKYLLLVMFTYPSTTCYAYLSKYYL
jgi:hypothetical protein